MKKTCKTKGCENKFIQYTTIQTKCVECRKKQMEKGREVIAKMPKKSYNKKEKNSIKNSIIPISKKKRKEIEENDFYKKCCHTYRPDNHICQGKIEMEHCFERRNNMQDIVVPVCKSMNTNPSKKDRAWSKLVAIKIYEIEELKKINPKKNWESEKRLCESFFK